MPAQSHNIFIVQTAESSQNGRPRGGNLSLINKQSALYKYKQQKKQRDSRSSSGRGQALPPRNTAPHRSSWLLESRLPKPVLGPDDALTDPESSPTDDEHDYTELLVAFRQDRQCIEEWEYDTDEAARLHNCYAGLRTDPFNCLPIASSVVLNVSDMYTNMMLPNLCLHARVTNIADVYKDIFWQMVFQEDTIDTVVAMAHCASFTCRARKGFAPNKALFTYGARSLAKLRQRLSDSMPANIGNLVCMLMYSCNIARFLGNFQAAKKHMSTLRQLLRHDPTLETLGYQGKLKALLLQWDYFLTLNNGEEPLVSRGVTFKPDYPSLPLVGDSADLVGTLPLGFQKLARSGRLSCQIMGLLGRSQEMIDAFANGTLNAWVDADGGRRPLEHRESLPFLDSRNSEGVTLEQMICYGIFVLTSRLVNPKKPAIWSIPATGGRAQITQQALNCPTDSNAEKHCLIWIWLIGIDAWGIANATMPVRGQILMEQLKARFPEAANWRHLSRVVKEFFWTDDLEEACKLYWDSEQ